MKRDYVVNLFLVLTLSSIALCSATPTRKRPWLGVLFEPKEKSNREHKLNLNEGTIYVYSTDKWEISDYRHERGYSVILFSSKSRIT